MDDMTKTTPPPTKREEEDQDVLSLSDFPLQNSSSDKKTPQDYKRRSSSEPSDFFEFFTADNNNNMSHAEDIFFRGKLVPFTNPHHPFLKSLSADNATRFSSRQLVHRTRRYPSDADKTLRRRRRQWTRSDDIRRNFSKRSAVSEGSPPTSKATKPKWFVLMFGPLKLQPEMDLREMKSRRGRRSPVSMFPGAAGGDHIPVGRRGFWGFDLLRVLSCKSHATVAAVTAPSVGLAPRC